MALALELTLRDPSATIGCVPSRGGRSRRGEGWVLVTADVARERRAVRGDFVKFWAGQTTSNLGSAFTLFALPLLVFTLTGSPLNLGVTMATSYLPYLLFGLVLGAWVDRKRLMIATDLARAVVIALLPVLADLGLLRVWWVYAIAFVHASLAIAFDTAEFAAIPSLVERKQDLVAANGRCWPGCCWPWSRWSRSSWSTRPRLCSRRCRLPPSGGASTWRPTVLASVARSAPPSPRGCGMCSATRCCAASR